MVCVSHAHITSPKLYDPYNLHFQWMTNESLSTNKRDRYRDFVLNSKAHSFVLFKTTPHYTCVCVQCALRYESSCQTRMTEFHIKRGYKATVCMSFDCAHSIRSVTFNSHTLNFSVYAYCMLTNRVHWKNNATISIFIDFNDFF